ncbi:hypothetical protein GSI_15494 [Ganoderma sinense ZZ0214-1]|uniref:Uncharacterized protein n=1 Tax=Ganoderma sinense ZZ0214-1 TaxID=1077348 RepID=A0A2G8RMR7_9APHY|nr:hypothetical protein GSI_15494 [Ganoderma sinense ZZ0214-1]
MATTALAFSTSVYVKLGEVSGGIVFGYATACSSYTEGGGDTAQAQTATSQSSSGQESTVFDGCLGPCLIEPLSRRPRIITQNSMGSGDMKSGFLQVASSALTA